MRTVFGASNCLWYIVAANVTMLGMPENYCISSIDILVLVWFSSIKHNITVSSIKFKTTAGWFDRVHRFSQKKRSFLQFANSSIVYVCRYLHVSRVLVSTRTSINRTLNVPLAVPQQVARNALPSRLIQEKLAVLGSIRFFVVFLVARVGEKEEGEDAPAGF